MQAPSSAHQKSQYQFLASDFTVTDWATIKPYYDQLLTRDLNSLEALKKWLLDRNELEGALSENFGWRYINMTRDTTNQAYLASYEQYVKDILPHIIPVGHHLNEKVVHCTHSQALKQLPGFDIMLQCLANSIRIYRKENVPMLTELQLKAQQYDQIIGNMTVQLAGKEYTLQQAGVYLEAQDRAVRQVAYEKINERRRQDNGVVDDLYTDLVRTRHQLAVNAGFSNFRDYAFVSMNRFDYTPQDCFDFHDAVATEVVPLLDDLAQERKRALGLTTLKPWDTQVDISQEAPLRPFDSAEELLQKSIETFDKLDPFFGDCLRTMDKMGHLDLDSRKGKSPGGYNYPLDEAGVPFIFMNATSTLRDMVTMMHEGGHALHSFLVNDLALNDFKHAPSEIAELASMSMELLTMDHWDVFFQDESALKRAKKTHLTDIIHTLAWVSTIDAFQHWIYEHPQHSLESRQTAWLEIFKRFSSATIDWSGQEQYKASLWQKQLHLFEVPFYYIEYGMAQLGAIAVWKNYQENPTKGLQGYLAALKLGHTRSIPATYQEAGIAFDFSQEYIRELIQFVQAQIAAL